MNAQIESFRAAIDEANRIHFAELEAKIPGYYGGVTVGYGKKFAKFIIETSGCKAVLFFVEIETGNIYKAANWAAPAKGVRGNIATAKPQAGTGWTYR